MIRRYGIADAGHLTKLIRRYWDDVSDDSYSMDGLGEHVYQVCTRPDVYAIGSDPKKNSFVFYPLGQVSCQIHVIASEKQGRLKLAHAAIGWMYDNTGFENISAFIPVYKRHVILFAEMCGMRRVGTLERSVRKGGELFDQVIYQTTRQEYREVYGWKQ